MKKMSPYTLVRKTSLVEAAEGTVTPSTRPSPARDAAKARENAARADTETKVNRLLARSPELEPSFSRLGEVFRRTLLDSIAVRVAQSAREKRTRAPGPKQTKAVPAARAPQRADRARPTKQRARIGSGASEVLSQIAHDLSRAPKVERIGLLDLGVWIAGLPDLLSRLNAAQDPYALFEINAPVPAGLRKTPLGIVDWMLHHNVTPSKTEQASLEPQVIANEFFAVGADIRSGMGLDMLIGLTPAMVAGVDDEGIYWNHFSAVSEDVALVSTADLRDFAKKAGRPFEAAVGVLLIGAVLVRFNAKLDYHPNRGCILDYNEDRTSLIETIRSLKICSNCTDKMDEAQRIATAEILKALRKMKGKPT